MVRTLQTWHLVSLALLIFFYGIFRSHSESYDYWRQVVDLAFTIGLSVWGALLTCYAIVDGIKEPVGGKIFRLYRRQLARTSFLLISNVMLSAIVGGLLWQLLFYRQVEFLINKDAYLYLNDKPGQTERVGLIKKEEPIRFRLAIGYRRLVFKTPGEDKLMATEPLSIAPVWARAAPMIFRKEFVETTYEEVLE